MKIVFMGTPEFGAVILEGLIKNNQKPILVVTAPDRPVGRKQILTPPPVKVIAQRYQISLLQPEKILTIVPQLKTLNPDLIVIAAYGKILPKEILEIPKYGSLNVHPSLLPKYRGPTPIQTTILNGDKETGVTIFLTDIQIDHGPILSQKRMEVSPQETTKTLSEELAKLGAELLVSTIPKWIREEIKLLPQDEKKATYTKILKKEKGKIDWSKSAGEIERQIRAFYPWPGSFTFWQKNDKKILQVKILKAEVLPQKEKPEPIGKTFIWAKNQLCVQAGKDILVIKELQIEGKKPMEVQEFLRGNKSFISTILPR